MKRKKDMGSEFIRNNRMILLASLLSHAKRMEVNLARLSMSLPSDAEKGKFDALCDHYRAIGDAAKESAAWIEENYPDESTFEEKMSLLDLYEGIFGKEDKPNADN